ncbi:hypothetical protein K458DRAFT_305959 [Lentithecium fluviatile CBS 122367]|uniref:ubiquitinyl hydrolase 1 n=1 Tax=Lentithecium fluviatile CBS 122367 TaxID=1168545 RepID=A0A6G1IYZ5_9PLEO|nr:hypothetical protein K458DRAFT_305959 [Lentithecium fluviatile CBS 122367]
MAAPNPEGFLLQQYFHAALPRDVPGREDRNLSLIESALLDRIIGAVKATIAVAPLEHKRYVDAIRLTLVTSKALNVDGKIDKHLLVKEIRDLQGDYALILHVTEQNAAVVIHKDLGYVSTEQFHVPGAYNTSSSDDANLVFEAYETSAASEEVLASEHALQWDFPGQAVSIPPAVWRDDSFHESLATFLEQASIESVKQFAAVTYKAAAPLPEIRDTTDPALVTGLLMTILETNGARYATQLLQKRVRDTVSFREAHKPWRRSPFYLAVRVAIQRHLYKLVGAEVGHTYYKIIMCIFLSRLLEDSLCLIPNEASQFLKQKLGRRLAKLEQDRRIALSPQRAVLGSLLQDLRTEFEKSLSSAEKLLANHWRHFRETTVRVIRPLPLYADPASKKLQLPVSGPVLNQILSGAPSSNQPLVQTPLQLIEHYEQSVLKAKPFSAVVDRYVGLSRFENAKVSPVMIAAAKDPDPEENCCQLAHAIELYVSKVASAFDGYPELKSRLILNLMELWVQMDRNAVECYPLLRKYHPGFDPRVMNTLELLSLDYMKRVQDAQTYLSHRCLRSADQGSKTIFATPAEDAFAVQYYDMSPEMANVREQIDRDAHKARQAKEEEWREMSQRHEHLMQQIAESTCPYITVTHDDGTVTREHQRGCLKHKYKWQAKQIKIRIFENPLPDSECAAKAAVFELLCPKAFAAYRDATWLLLATFAYPPDEAVERITLVRPYSELQKYANRTEMNVTLGSSKKSHLECHYSDSGFPVALNLVCRPCGLELDYFDTSSQTWATRDGPPSYSSHFPLNLPPGSPYGSLRIAQNNWPSSNKILSSQTKCPMDLNVHEFMAWQGLLVGTHSRWLSLLRELGATNLNFSSESTWAVVTKLLLQVGPSSSDSVLRDVHIVFNDRAFCTKMLEQIRHRIMAIRRNWREPVQMDVMISILLKMASLSVSTGIRSKAFGLLDECREATRSWCRTLQSSDNNGSKEVTNFTIWASVLCKRTFQGSLGDIHQILRYDTLACFVYASVTLQENLVSRFDQLPFGLRNAILRDLTFTYNIRAIVRSAILANWKPFLSALNDVWPIPDNFLASAPNVHAVSNTWWIEVTMRAKNQQKTHLIHYHVLRGDLLIDGKASGTLPAEYRKFSIIEMLFGTLNLRVLPSYEPGMSLFVARCMPHKHWIHLGLRGGKLVVRATQAGVTLELVPNQVFRNINQFDLPSPLIDNCFHWLNLRTGVLEIRQDDIWKTKDGNWKLNVRTRTATRRASMLVDPNSPLGALVAQNFCYFEYAPNITVYQPSRKHLSVELKRLELNFYVNASGLLQSPQLDAEIVPSSSQDAGVWYGLKSKIVLRSTANRRQRSILVPTGPFMCRKDSEHVSIVIQNDGTYLKFDINDVLGRLECPPEPRLLYSKALWHAYTSHFLPDPLTGRTGREEALFLLQSGLYKPWTYLPSRVIDLLVSIAKLTPRRTYYPPSLKCMETVYWESNWPTTIQDDSYRAIVEEICQRSSMYALFETRVDALGDKAPQCPHGNPHLEARAITRSGHRSGVDQIYSSRDGQTSGPGRANAAEVSTLLFKWPSSILNTSKLISLLQKYPVIGGCVGGFDRVQLFDLLTVNLGESWGALVESATKFGPGDRYRLMFLFASMAFSPSVNMELLRVVLSFAVIPDLGDIPYPKWPSYLHFQGSEAPSVKDLTDLMKEARKPYIAKPVTKAAKPGQLALVRINHEEASLRCCVELATSIHAQWPQVAIDMSKLVAADDTLLDFDQAMELVRGEWTRLAQNFEFSRYLEMVQTVLNRHGIDELNVAAPGGSSPNVVIPHSTNIYPTRARSQDTPCLRKLLSRTVFLDAESSKATVLSDRTNAIKAEGSHKVAKHSSECGPANMRNVPKDYNQIQELSNIASSIRNSSSSVQQKYGLELEQSIAALVEHINQPSIALASFNPYAVDDEIARAKQACNTMLDNISRALERENDGATWLKYGGTWPRMTVVSLLSELRSTSETSFGEGAKEALVQLGLKITTLQRLLRIQDAARKHKEQQLYDERANRGHLNWRPLEYVDWLLLEIDSNMMLREEQVEVAFTTISPSSGQNSVVQLLMGKGKTSCILPMVAAVLADKHNLLRIVVPRPLLLQSAQVMQAKLGGLLNREVMHVPFSRKTRTDRSLMQTYAQLHIDLRKSNGILLALPEHILSHKLSGMQRLCDGHLEDGTRMIKFQGWLDRHARDVLDECDVSLAIRTQLIYPSGSQMTVDGHPLRWQTVQAVLRLLKNSLKDLEMRFPKSIEVVERPVGEFPLVYFLRSDVEDYLITQIVEHICRGQLVFLPCAEIPASSQEDIQCFISSPVVSSQVVAKVIAMFKDKQHSLNVVYHLRGLFVHRILLSMLKKRWNVQYGLRPSREPIAVPYQAKGVPSPTSEWGHPDAAIILTCLSFYYQGLDIVQFKRAFEQLLKSDEPSIEYEKWATEVLPGSLRDYNAINVEDSSQLRDLHGYVQYNMYLLDFYLNNFVFPRHAKQFTMKLQASGWDLVQSGNFRCRTTGFSGTNDSRHQLPMTIQQNDELKKLSHTNAEVLWYLLFERNRRYILAVGPNEKRLSEVELLEKLLNPLGKTGLKIDEPERIRIFIDAGAQILEHSNQGLAAAWLKIDHEADAAVFFDTDHRPRVLYRKGKSVPLVATPFAENLEKCLVYLDESHCRGTDLKLPPNARAALTLGPHVTKDALAQAAMRLRLLGQSQAVTFISPPEVNQSILDMRKGSEDCPIDSSHVIQWLLRQSCNGIEQLEPLYFTQGNTYLQHAQAKIDNPMFLENVHQRDRYLSIMRTKELQTLKQLYQPKSLKRGAESKTMSFAPALRAYAEALEQRKIQFQDHGIAIHSSALEEVEQEREVEFEVESVREIQIPVHFEALKIPRLHKDIAEFVKSGRFIPGTDAYQPMFSALQKTALGLKHRSSFNALSTSPGLYVSTQYSRTVKVFEANDNFLRPCQWVLWNRKTKVGLVVNPEEADALLPMLRGKTGGGTHLIVYSAPVTRRMLHFNSLDYHATPTLPSDFTIPEWFKIELGIFSGRLYFGWDEYEELCAYLGVKQAVASDEDFDANSREVFAKNPLTFLHEWLAVLRKGQDFEHTPMGFVTTGKPLHADHPFFLAAANDHLKHEPEFHASTDPDEDDEEDSDDDDGHDDDEIFQRDHGAHNGHHEVEHEDDEFDEENNTFFDTPDYFETTAETPEGQVEDAPEE